MPSSDDLDDIMRPLSCGSLCLHRRSEVALWMQSVLLSGWLAPTAEFHGQRWRVMMMRMVMMRVGISGDEHRW